MAEVSELKGYMNYRTGTEPDFLTLGIGCLHRQGRQRQHDTSLLGNRESLF